MPRETETDLYKLRILLEDFPFSPKQIEDGVETGARYLGQTTEFFGRILTPEKIREFKSRVEGVERQEISRPMLTAAIATETVGRRLDYVAFKALGKRYPRLFILLYDMGQGFSIILSDILLNDVLEGSGANASGFHLLDTRLAEMQEAPSTYVVGRPEFGILGAIAAVDFYKLVYPRTEVA